MTSGANVKRLTDLMYSTFLFGVSPIGYFDIKLILEISRDVDINKDVEKMSDI